MLLAATKLLRPQERLRIIVTSMSVCLCACLCVCVCLSVREDIPGTTRAILTIFVHIVHVRGSSSSGIFTIGRIDYRQKRGFLPHWKCIVGRERGMGVYSAGEVCYLQLACYYGRPMEKGRPLYFCSVVSLLLLSSFSSPNLSGRRLDVYHTSTHSVALLRI